MIAAIYIYNNSFPHLFGEGHEEMTINFGGEYLYEVKFHIQSLKFNVTKRSNPSFLEPFFNKLSNSKLEGLSCIIGNNGAGKSTLLKEILVDHRFIFIEEDGHEYKLVDMSYDELNFIRNKLSYHRFYYSPVLNFETLGAVGVNAVDWSKTAQFFNDNGGDTNQLKDYVNQHKSEYIKRWIRFNDFYISSGLNLIGFPFYKTVRVKLIRNNKFNRYNQDYDDTSYAFRPVFNLIFNKISEESVRKMDSYKQVDGLSKDDFARVIQCKYHFYEDLVGKIISCLESIGNRFLLEGVIPDFLVEQMRNVTVEEAIVLFLEEAFFEEGREILLNQLSEPVSRLMSFMEDAITSDVVSKENWTVFILPSHKTLELINLYEDFNNIFLQEPFEYNELPIFIFSPEINLSSGEQAVLNLFSTLYHHRYCINANIPYDNHSSKPFANVGGKILIMLDEGDSGFHPAWKKSYVALLRALIPLIYERYDVQVIITTHDPITLSDLPKHNVVFLKKEEGKTLLMDSEDKKTFAANVSDLLKDSFFIENGLIGDWANETISKFITFIKEVDFREGEYNIKEIEAFIRTIDEPIIKFKLAEMYDNRMKKRSLEVRLIDEEIEALQRRKRRLE